MIFAIISYGFNYKFKEELMYNTNIEIIGRDFIYYDAIEEFCEKYKKIEWIIISGSFYTKYKNYLQKIFEDIRMKKFIILFDILPVNVINNNNVEFYSIEDFIKTQKNLYIMELKKGDFEMEQELGVLDNIKSLNQDLINSNNIENEQKEFLETNIGKAVNIGLDIGIRALLPNVIEDGVISVKNAILENGFKDGIKQSIDDVIEISRSAGKVLSGNFENIEQIQMAVKSGGLIDSFSGLLDLALKFANQMGSLDQTTYQMLKAGKNTILNTISSKIDDELTNQLKYVQKVQNYSNKWKEAYENKDFNSMERAYKNMENYLDKSMPFEKTLKEARTIENLHNLILNNGKKFDLSENEIELSKMLAI